MGNQLGPPGNTFLGKALARKITRRDFLKATAGMIAGAAVMAIGGWTYTTKIEPGWVEYVSQSITLPRLHPAFDGFQLAQISDIHLSRALTAEHVAEVSAWVLKKKPDLVALTGDFIDTRGNLAQKSAQLSDAFRPLVKEIQSVAIMGNHDYRVGATTIRKMLDGLGVHELNNEVLTLERGGEHFFIAGLDDIWRGRPRLYDVLDRLPMEGAAVLLAHEPDYADVSAETGRFDLQISGHSHGGQVVFPFIGPPITSFMGKKYYSGLYQVGNMIQYTNRGLGMTAPYIRFNCRPEVTLFTFRSGMK